MHVREVPISHPDKVLFPGAGVTKAGLAEHFERVADRMLPHIRDRPLSLQVFPGGVARPGHFMKQAPDYFPDWVRRVTVPKKGGEVTHVVANDADTLRLLANHNAITLHIPTSRRDRPDRPDRLIVDLDPSDDQDWPAIVAGARLVADMFRQIGLEPFAMATGSRGLHVVAPLRRELGYPEIFAFAKAISLRAAAESPDHLTTEFLKVSRDDRIFVDVLRNRWAQTAVAPYSPRAKPDAPVATPLEWDEVEAAGPRPFTIATLPPDRRDPWAAIGDAAASPRAAAKRVGGGTPPPRAGRDRGAALGAPPPAPGGGARRWGGCRRPRSDRSRRLPAHRLDPVARARLGGRRGRVALGTRAADAADAPGQRGGEAER